MRILNLAALTAALTLAFGLMTSSASAFVFDEAPETGFKIDMPGGWVEKNMGKDADMFKERGGAWGVFFRGPSRTNLVLQIVRADPKKFASAQEWTKNEVIGLNGKEAKDSFLPDYASDGKGNPYKYSYDDAVESGITLSSGEPATLTQITGLTINRNKRNVAFISFERNGFWYVAVLFNVGATEKLDDTIASFLAKASFLPGTVGSVE